MKQLILPKGWVDIPLGQILQPSKERFDPAANKDTTFIGLEHIESNTGRIVKQGKSKSTSSIKTVFRSGDILYGRLRPYLNKVCVPDFNGVCSTDILVFPKRPFVSNKYIALFLSTPNFVAYTNKNATGVQHPRISFKKIAEFQISLPPLLEQKRIVARVESLFSKINTTKQSLVATLSLLKRHRQSVLNHAFRGMLINTNSAIKLKWTKMPLSDIALVTPGQSPPSFDYNREKRGLPFFQGKANFGLRHPMPEVWCDKPRKVAKKGDILISVRAPVGPVNICDEDCGIGRGLASIRPFSKINSMYVFYHLHFLEAVIAAKGTGTTFKAITGDQLKSTVLHVAPPCEQDRIVSKIESLFTKIDNASQSVETSLLLLEQHRTSILNHAFKGGCSVDTVIDQ